MSGEKGNTRPELLLHSCCGPCSTAVIERLISRYRLTVFYYNPNITEKAEYEKRRETQKAYLEVCNQCLPPDDWIRFLEGTYDPQRYFELVRGLEGEPEGGARCTVCFRMRLAETAAEAKRLGFTHFTTTLSVSPHKNFPLIAALGESIGAEQGVSFLAEDFKKKAGYQRSVELSREWGLYRQNFCGCEFAKGHLKQTEPASALRPHTEQK